jgi:hypothetical protein
MCMKHEPSLPWGRLAVLLSKKRPMLCGPSHTSCRPSHYNVMITPFLCMLFNAHGKSADVVHILQQCKC